MFAVSEVHPFDDGNGRIARIMMNAELVNSGQAKIIIPTVFREDYFGSLRKLTQDGKPSPFVRAMQRAHEFSALIAGEDWEQTTALLKEMNAFLEPVDGNKIKMPHKEN
jgi:Fic family protein